MSLFIKVPENCGRDSLPPSQPSLARTRASFGQAGGSSRLQSREVHSPKAVTLKLAKDQASEGGTCPAEAPARSGERRRTFSIRTRLLTLQKLRTWSACASNCSHF